MISKSLKHSPVVEGNIQIPLMPLIERLIIFLENHLPQYKESITDKKSKLQNEKLLNQDLVDYLNGHSSEQDYGGYITYKFIFRKDDERADTTRRPDIGVTIWNNNLGKSKYDSFFQIECKRLPTPSISKDRVATEYVIGTEKNRGAIERFKRSEHGFHLNEAAIIGYVEENTIDYWHKKISAWINAEIQKKPNDLNWKNNDHLTIIEKKGSVYKYYSLCCRGNNSSDIKLHHFLINLQ